MTKWQSFPLRPQGRPWAGLNTRSGKLDDGSGQMTDASINCIINKGDQLEKRKGIVRGLDERFSTVCGLHRYTDECGREWLIVADSDSFNIRQPFVVPSFGVSDAYPNDDFEIIGAVDTSKWNGSSIYTQLGGSLNLASLATDGGLMTWFKEATNLSYQLQANYVLDGDSTITLSIKGSGISPSRIEGRINLSGSVVIASIVLFKFDGSQITIASSEVPNVATGSFEISYSRNSGSNIYQAQMKITPTGGSEVVILDDATINGLIDADFGQNTGVRIQRGITATDPAIESVLGGAI